MGFDHATLDRAVQRRVRASAEERARSRTAIARGQPLQAEEDSARRIAFERRLKQPIAPPAAVAALEGAERVFGLSVDFVDASFLALGAIRARAVAVVMDGGSPLGSGFLIGPGLFITNNHVIADAEACAGLTLAFDWEVDEALRPRVPSVFGLDPAACFQTMPYTALDFTVVAVGARRSGPGELAGYGCCPLSDRSDKHAKGMSVNIVQHPNGWFKKAVLRENRIVARGPFTLHYETDTEGGSSGAPVFNDAWEVVALHHWGAPHLATRTEDGETIPLTVNEGVRISSIIAELRTRAAAGGSGAALLAAALALGDADAASPAAEAGRPALPPSPGPDPMPMISPPPVVPEAATARIVLPIEITIRLLPTAPTGIAEPAPPPVPALAPELPPGPERVRIDPNYDNRRGYDPAFLAIALPLPKPGGPVAPLLRPNRRGLANVLDYQNFSLAMRADRRMAYYTATNIDGATLRPIDRDTGLLAAEASETWYDDPRIDPVNSVPQSYYSAHSDIFDRGHLTRRSDPAWGTPTRAIRANADTFHRTNCAPQHWRFNQSTQFWQGVERFYLEFGAAVDHARLSVLQGPVMAGTDPEIDGLQIPLQFWKIVIRAERGRLKATGFLVSQEALLGQPRRGMAPPTSETAPQVDQFRAAISRIERLTGLAFGPLAGHDTFVPHGPPGAEAAELVRIGDWSDLL